MRKLALASILCALAIAWSSVIAQVSGPTPGVSTNCGESGISATGTCLGGVSGAGTSTGTSSGGGSSFAGLGNLGLGPAFAYWSCGRAYNLAQATAGNPTCDVVRASDSASCTINLASAGFADTTTAYCNSNTQTITQFCNATTCKVSKAYDQSWSTNCGAGPSACDATQGTDASRPVLNLAGTGSKICMTFAGGQSLSTSTTFNATNGVIQPFTITAVSKRTGGTTNFADIFGASSNALQFLYNNAVNQVGPYAGTLGAAQQVAATDNTSHALQAIYNTTSSVMVVDGTATTGLSPGSNNILNGVAMTLGNNNHALTGEICEVSLYAPSNFAPWSPVFSAAQYAASDVNMKSTACGYSLSGGATSCGSISGITKSIITEGDSITAGYNIGGLINAYPTIYTTLGLPAGTQIYDVAISGSTLANLVTRAAQDQGGYIPGSAGKTVCTSLTGANDLQTYPGATDLIAATAYANAIFALAATWKANGCTKVGIGTILSTANATENARRNIVNPLLRAAVGNQIDFVIDFAADPVLGTDTSCADTPSAWAPANCIHPSQTSQTNIMEPLFATAVNAQ